MAIQSSKVEKSRKEDRLAIFKPGLMVFLDVAKNGTVFSSS